MKSVSSHFPSNETVFYINIGDCTLVVIHGNGGRGEGKIFSKIGDCPPPPPLPTEQLVKYVAKHSDNEF